MPKKNQVKGYATQALAGGRTGHYWKPTPRERREGWSTIAFGTGDDGRRTALLGCLARNEEVERLRALAGGAGQAMGGRRASLPVSPRWRDLAAAFRADPAFLDLKPKSRAEYASRMSALGRWALDGELRLASLDRQMVIELRDTLVADGRKHRTAALLRVLRILLNFAARKGWMAEGVASAIAIPEPPSRKRIVAVADVYALVDRARAGGDAAMALALLLAFWTLQREGDLLALNRLSWRQMKDMTPFARRILAGPDGLVFGFRVQQGKTGAWVDLPLPHAIRQEVEAGFAASAAAGDAQGLLLPRPGASGPWPDWSFQRAFRSLVGASGMADVQFRDLRRSGMIYSGELGVEIQFITARSGHAVLGNKRTILDTYMPGNSRFSAEGMAIAWSRHLERIAEAEAEQGEAK
jgi:hypothetical protein